MHDDPIEMAAQFRPASAKDFQQFAKNLQQVIQLPLQKCQEVLAQIYGYSGAHELRQVLAVKGDAGFFNDDLATLPWAQRDPLQQSRRKRVTEIVLAALSEGTPREAGLLCQYMGFFRRPTAHRAQFARMQEAIRLVKDLAWPAEAAAEVSFRYKLAGEINFDLMESGHVVAGSRFDPHEMVATLRAFREPALFVEALDRRAEDGDDDGFEMPAFDLISWDHYIESVWPNPHWQEIGIDWGEYVMDVLRPHLGLGSPDGTDEEYDELDGFPEAPSEIIARRNSLLKDIPNIIGIARHWNSARYGEIAHRIVERRKASSVPFILKTESGYFDLDGERADGWLDCYAALTLRAELEDYDSMSIYDYTATFLHRIGNDASDVIGEMHGMLVVPFKGQYCPGGEDFMWGMDAISAMANDVWKVIVFEYFKKLGCADVQGFLRMRPQGMFLVATAEIAPSYRGKGLLEEMANLLCETIGGGVYSQFDHGWRQLSSDTGIDLGMDEDDADEELGTVTTMIFPVEGTKPRMPLQASVADLISIPSPRKVRIPPNPEIEARRQKLERHFLDLQGKVSCEDFGDKAVVDILVYDPWAYPVT